MSKYSNFGNKNQTIFAYFLIFVAAPIIATTLYLLKIEAIGVYLSFAISIFTVLAAKRSQFAFEQAAYRNLMLENRAKEEAAAAQHAAQEAQHAAQLAQAKLEKEEQQALAAKRDRDALLEGNMQMSKEYNADIELRKLAQDRTRTLENFIRELMPTLPKETQKTCLTLLTVASEANSVEDGQIDPQTLAIAKMLTPGTPDFNVGLALTAKAIELTKAFEIEHGRMPSFKEANREIAEALKLEANALGLKNQYNSPNLALVTGAINMARANPKDDNTKE